MKRKNLLYLLLLLTLGSGAQTRQWGTLTEEDGLHSATVTSVLRDQYGFVFFGTEQGVSRFDGTHLLNIDFPENNTQRNLRVNTIMENDRETLLIGNNVGLWKVDRRHLSMRRVHQDVIDTEVFDLLRTSDGTLFIATAQGLFKMSHDRVEAVNIFAHQPTNNHSVRKTAVCGKHLCLLAANRVATAPVERPEAARFHSLPAPFTHATLLSMASDKKRVYLGTREHGLLVFNPKTNQFSSLISDIHAATNLSVDAQGQLLVVTAFDGCMQVDPNRRTITHRYTSQPLASSADVTRMRINNAMVFCRDNEGIDWIGYNFFGVDYSYLNRGIFHTFRLPGVFDSADYAVRSFLLDGDRILMGTRNGLYVVDQKQKTAAYVGRETLGADIVSSIRKVGDAYLVGTIGGGVHRISANTLAPMPSPQLAQLARANIYDMVSDDKGGVWICSSAGLGHYSNGSGTLHLYTTRNSQLPDNEVFCIGLANDGQGWISTASGQCMWNSYYHMITTSGMMPRLVKMGMLRSIKRLANGRMIFIPQNGFPGTIDPAEGILRGLSFNDLDSYSTLLDILPFGDKCYIITCSDAIYFVDKQGTARRFGHIDGLANSQFQSHAIQIDESSGTYWAATNGGLVYAKLSDIRQTKFRHIPITLSEIQTDHWFTPEEISGVLLDSLLTLSRHDNEFTVRFTPLAFGNTRDLTFRYQLEGHEDHWNMADRTRIIAYRNLWPGRYTLRIEAVGMPEVNGCIVVDVPMTSNAILLLIIVLLLLALIGHVAWCRYHKKPYFWKRFAPQPVKYQKSRLDKKEGRKWEQALLSYMEKEKPYLNPDLQMADLAHAIGCSTHTLSQVFSQVLNRSYYDFIAEYRIKAFMKLAQQPDSRTLTITALAERCGFKSRNPFLVAFKKATGMTPKDYMKSLKE